MKKTVAGMMLVVMLTTWIFCGTAISESDDYSEWIWDSRLRYEWDESDFGHYGVDEWIYIGSEYMIFIHYKQDLTGGYCYWCEFIDGEEWLRGHSGDVTMKELGDQVETWAIEFLKKLDEKGRT